MPGPGRKPAQLKAIAGTARKDRAVEAVELELLDSVPSAPDWLPNAHAVKEFDRLAPILHKVRLLTTGGIMTLGHLCALHGKIVQLYAAGESPTANMIGQYRSMANDFGLTPVAQGKVRSAGETKEGNRFAGNGRKQEA